MLKIIFTFHYVSTYTRCHAGHAGEHEIYIPLCFYLYLSQFTVSSMISPFTFHYVSTYTVWLVLVFGLPPYLHSTMFLLIQSQTRFSNSKIQHLHSTMFLLIPRSAEYSSVSLPDLHSTMFLLIPAAPMFLMSVNNIYIPLCFYLYSERSYSGSAGSTFTFHYVSTYT